MYGKNVRHVNVQILITYFNNLNYYNIIIITFSNFWQNIKDFVKLAYKLKREGPRVHLKFYRRQFRLLT